MPDDRDAVLRLLARERLGIDRAAPGRTTFLSHFGAIPKLIPGPWIGHRELLYALALANLSPEQRRSLAQAVLIDYDREFGVGRLVLRAVPSGLPFGGSSLALRPRSGGGPRCLYTWALGVDARPEPCDWLLLRAQPEWALDDGGCSPLDTGVIRTHHALGIGVVIFVPAVVEARQVADACLRGIPFTAHPRFLPHLDRGGERGGDVESGDGEARIALWPADAVASASLARRAVGVALVVDGREATIRAIRRWAAERSDAAEAAGEAAGDAAEIEVLEASCPGRVDREGLLRFWEACERPRILLRGDPAWTGPGQRWLESVGAAVELQAEGTQLGLFEPA